MLDTKFIIIFQFLFMDGSSDPGSDVDSGTPWRRIETNQTLMPGGMVVTTMTTTTERLKDRKVDPTYSGTRSVIFLTFLIYPMKFNQMVVSRFNDNEINVQIWLVNLRSIISFEVNSIYSLLGWNSTIHVQKFVGLKFNDSCSEVCWVEIQWLVFRSLLDWNSMILVKKFVGLKFNDSCWEVCWIEIQWFMFRSLLGWNSMIRVQKFVGLKFNDSCSEVCWIEIQWFVFRSLNRSWILFRRFSD